MDYAAAADALMRQRMLEDIYGRMTDDEKKLFVQMTMQQHSTDEILAALQQQRMQMDRMEKRMEQQNWATGFGSDVAANLFTDGLLLLARQLFRR